MKKMISMMTSILALCGVAKADIQKANALSSEESKKVAEALLFLKEKEVLKKDSDGKVDVDKDIIDKLKSEGYLQKKDPQIQVICGGTGGHS